MPMKPTSFLRRAALLAVVVFRSASIVSEADPAPRAELPDAVVDLRTAEGVARLKAQWRYSDTRIQEINHRGVGPDLKASGPKNRTFDFTPDARASDFDDSKWEIIPADSLEMRRGHGRLSLNWYRLTLAIPERSAVLTRRGRLPCLKWSWTITRKSR